MFEAECSAAIEEPFLGQKIIGSHGGDWIEHEMIAGRESLSERRRLNSDWVWVPQKRDELIFVDEDFFCISFRSCFSVMSCQYFRVPKSNVVYWICQLLDIPRRRSLCLSRFLLSWGIVHRECGRVFTQQHTETPLQISFQGSSMLIWIREAVNVTYQ